jgi:hypothetical protein
MLAHVQFRSGEGRPNCPPGRKEGIQGETILWFEGPDGERGHD